jgi:hypothetical protein
MTRPETLFEVASYELNKFRERRMAERRSEQRDAIDRRCANQNATTPTETQDGKNAEQDIADDK